jgi:hypothetical protein
MSGERVVARAGRAGPAVRSVSIVVWTIAGLMIPWSPLSCSPSTGTSCETAGGRCVLGGASCAQEAASSAQDCNPSPPNPGGAFCCLALAEGGNIVADSAAASVPDAAEDADGGACIPVLASSYDQSCTVDSDCVAVGEVPSCPAAACDGCTTQAVNRGATTEYRAALARAFASAPAGTVCGCPCESGAVCRAGQCQAAFCGPPSGDTLSACRDSGGTCAYTANTTCGTLGPPDACAYDDELCCVP